ncbi:MAG TPA: hypothetical protein VMT18_06065 [Planctomycetota bacterium]|nr:hypothetical protein [Planctomycetota bacterium]
MGHPRRGDVRLNLIAAVTCVLLVAAVAVRGIAGERPPQPEDEPRSPDALVEPLQFLARNGALRMRELGTRIDPARATEWAAMWRRPYELENCPAAAEWLGSPDGLRLERLLAELRRGSRDEALAALALTVQLARATDWDPGLLGRSQHAERIGGLLQDWLRVWGPRAAGDGELLEPTLAALLVYGRVMRTAYKAPAIGRADAPYERARAFLDDLTGARAARRTPLGERLAARHPRAWTTLVEKSDFLAGAAEESRALFPEIDGECGR